MKTCCYRHFIWLILILGCTTNDPAPENAEEIITIVTLNFDAPGGALPLVFEAVDPDGDGPQDLVIEDEIKLAPETQYVLTIDLLNSLNGDSISEEVAEEADEHMFFFSWTDGIFSSPSGSGNVNNGSSDVDYNDQDVNGLPLGLSTTWFTTNSGSGTFRILLKHQPGSKTGDSDATIGETDLDLTWNIAVE